MRKMSAVFLFLYRFLAKTPPLIQANGGFVEPLASFVNEWCGGLHFFLLLPYLYGYENC